MLTIYMLNVRGEVMYGECMADEYERVANDAQGRGFAISVIDEIGCDYLRDMSRRFRSPIERAFAVR